MAFRNTPSLPLRWAHVVEGQEMAGGGHQGSLEEPGKEGPNKAQQKEKVLPHGKLAAAPLSWERLRQPRELPEKPGHCRGPFLISLLLSHPEDGGDLGSLVPMSDR